MTGTPTTWIQLELEPGAAQFLDLPLRISVPWDGPALGAAAPSELPGSVASLSKALGRAVELNPEMAAEAQVHRFLARGSRLADLEAYWKVGNATFAAKVAQDLLRADPGDPVALSTLGREALQEGQYASARAFLAKALERAPDHGPTQLDYAVALAGDGDGRQPEEALTRLQPKPRGDLLSALFQWEIRQGHTQALGPRLARARALFSRLASEPSRGTLEELTAVFPENPAALFFRVTHALGYPEESGRVVALERVVSLDPGRTEARSLLADYYRRDGRLEAALNLLDEAPVGEEPNVIAARGLCLEQAGDRDAALAAYRMVYEMPVDRIPRGALAGAGYGLLRTGHPDESRSLFSRVLESHPSDPLPYQLLARLEDLGGHSEQAELHLRSGLKQCPRSTGLIYTLGDLLRRQGRATEAKGTFKSLVRDAPQEPWGHRGLGDLALGRDAAQALKHYTRALELDPSTPIPGLDYLMGLRALREGKMADAETALQRAVAGEPDSARYWGDLSTARFYNHKIQPAITAGLQAHRLDPKNPGYAHNLAVFHRTRFKQQFLTHWKSYLMARRFEHLAGRLARENPDWEKDLWEAGTNSRL